ncbi:LysR family transcriptional regulator [Henriciella marina]|uniref:LysR family transcriptional regulator n=1 Tax=Henriciella marina TaxID=453851 RepID=UPI00039E8EB0|nr:LysR family transcriptional regulator [Henriciella marina]
MKKNQLDWDKLRVFGVVAELKSFTAAAKRLGESTPTVSRKIDELEKMLRCDLFTRTTKGVELTEAGWQVVKRTHSMGDQANEIINTLSGIDKDGGGSLRLAGQDGVASHWITKFIPEFQAENELIDLDIQILDHEIDLIASESDLSITFTEPRHRDIMAIRLGVLHYMFFSTETYLKGRAVPESLYDLRGHDVLIHDAYSHQIERWSTRAVDLKKALRFKLHTNSGTVLKEICASGGGIAVMPSYVIDIDDRLVALDLPEVAPIQFWLTYSPRIQRLSRGRALIDWLRKQFSSDRSPWFQETFVNPNRFETYERRLRPEASPGAKPSSGS